MAIRKRSWMMVVTATGLLLLFAVATAAQGQMNPPPPQGGTEDPSALLLGIVKLQGSTDAVSSQQAAQLLALVQAWRMQMMQPPAAPAGALRQPGQAPTGQPSPGTSLADGIRAILNPVQWQVIVVMDLSASDVTQWMGLPAFGNPTPSPGGSPQGQPPATPPAGGSPGTLPPPGGAQPDSPMVQFADAVIALLTSWIAAP
ncbi:MAG: hypothetical protein NTY63_00560 [Candidatus Bipolaricaulota bacterium]|nr:hypothetical protein [Candidatus Bipolaricaulota bacterium]